MRIFFFLIMGLLFALDAQAQIAFRAAASAGVASGAAGTITHIGAGGLAANPTTGCDNTISPARPAGNVGDLLIAVVNSRENSATVSASAGWTLLHSTTHPTAGDELQGHLFYRFATGTLATDDAITVTQTGACSALYGRVVRFRNVDATAPFHAVPVPASNVSTVGGNNLVSGSETTLAPNEMLLVAGFINDNRTVTATGWNQSFDDAVDVPGGGGNSNRDLGISLHYLLQAAPGTTSVSWDLNGAGGDPSIGVILALRPQLPSLTINVPAGTIANDVMVAAIAVRDSSVVINPPAGWTAQAATVQAAGNSSRQQTFYRVAGGGEPASYTWTFASDHTGAAGGIVSYSGVDTTTPVDAFAGNATPQGSDTNLQHRALSVDTSTLDTLVVSSHSFSSAETWTPPAGMTERVEIASEATPAGGGISLQMNDAAQAAVGATGDKVATAAGNGDNGVAQLIALRPVVLPPVLEFAADESLWTGAVGEVADSSGNGLHGRSFNGAATAGAAPAIAGNPGSCRYGAFDGADDYVETADNALLDIADELTVMAWIRPNTLPAGGNLKSIVSKDGNFEFHLDSAGRVYWWWGGGALQLTTAGAVPTGAWTHVAIVYSRAGAFQRIYLNGVQDANTNNQTAALATNAQPFQIGADQGFAGRNFDGHIDEVRVFAQALGAGRIQQYMNTTRACAALIDHFSISHSGGGVACQDQTITFTAHDAGHAAVDAGGLTIALTTSNAKGTWTGIVSGGGLLTDPVAGDGAASYTFAPGSMLAQLSFRYADLAATSESFGFNASGGGYAETSGSAMLADDPSFTMAQAGFQFRNATDGNTTIPTQISGKPSDTGFGAKTIRLRAIRTDTATGSCTGLFASQTRSVDLGAECGSPSACAGRQVSINGGSIPTSNDNAGPGAAAFGNVSLTFNAGSEADAVVSYPDAGQISLHARYDLDPGIAGFEMIGSSNAFVVRPFGLAFPGVAHSSTAGGTPLAAAGDPFSMMVSAYQWAPGQDGNLDGVPDTGANITGNGTTPNYAATVTVGVGANLPGIASGAISRGGACAGAPTLTVAAGTGLASDWCYSEAGNVLFTASAADYLGSGQDVTGTSGLDGDAGGGYVGRFHPKDFALSAGALTNRAAAACSPASAFTYMNEALTLGFTLTARNAQGATTQNYTGAYAKLVPTVFGSFNFGARSGATDLSTRVDNGLAPSGAWANGVAAVSATTAIRRATPDDPDGPFAGLQFGIAPVDTDGVAMTTLDLDVDNNAANDHKALGVATEIRFGRLRLQNGVGSEKLSLRIPAWMQYWDGGTFATNTLDSCTRLPLSSVALDFAGGANLAACETSVTGAPVSFASGVGTLTLAAPGAANNGSLLLAPQLGNAAAGSYCTAPGGSYLAAAPALLSYLLGRWNDGADPDADASTAYDDNPIARASFGVYGRQPRNFIFYRENY